jgi:hypothetical protein
MKNLSDKFEGIQEIKQNVTFPFASEGTFSMHELLEFLLTKTGPASVRITSFSITEAAVRSFLNLMEAGVILRLECLFDISVKRHKLGLLYFVNNVASSIALAKCHAKLILIENDKWRISVIGSANFQVNDKIEAGVISTQPGFLKFYWNRFTLWFLKGILISKDEFI